MVHIESLEGDLLVVPTTWNSQVPFEQQLLLSSRNGNDNWVPLPTRRAAAAEEFHKYDDERDCQLMNNMSVVKPSVCRRRRRRDFRED